MTLPVSVTMRSPAFGRGAMTPELDFKAARTVLRSSTAMCSGRMSTRTTWSLGDAAPAL